jgi:hypothetical protein
VRFAEGAIRGKPGFVAVVAAVEGLLVGFLHSVVGKGLPRNLATGEPPPVGKRRQINGFNGPAFLQEVKHLVGAFVHKGDRAHLDADGLPFARGFCGTESGQPSR